MKRTEKLTELKRELEALSPPELLKIVLRIAKHKVENKELLSYLLFDAHDPLNYAEYLKDEMEAPYLQAITHPYYLLKGLRKSLRLVTKYYRFTGNRNGEVELLLKLVSSFHAHYKSQFKYAALSKFIFRCLEKAEKSIEKLHEDLQADYIEIHAELMRNTLARLGTEYVDLSKFRFSR